MLRGRALGRADPEALSYGCGLLNDPVDGGGVLLDFLLQFGNLQDGEQLPGRDAVADVDRDRLQIARHLGMHLDLLERPELGRDRERLRDVAACDAGHGDSRGDQWYFIPYEVTQPERDEQLTAGAVSSAMISEELVKIRSQKVLLLLDACRSGGAVVSFRGYEDRKSLAQLARSAGVHIIAASGASQLAAEVEELRHGLFTYVLLAGLKGEAVVGAGNRSVTVRGLLAYIEDQLPEVSKKYKAEAQYPVSSSKGQDFPVALLR